MGLSQGAVAKSLGITFQQVQKYEKGVNALNANRLYQFAVFMHVPVAYFFEGLEQIPLTLLASKHAVKGFAEEDGGAFAHAGRVSDRESLEMMKAFRRIGTSLVCKRLADLVRAIADNRMILE